jgi:uncharacterized protein YuzE
MTEPIIKYDEMSDTLYISFSPGEKATGIKLNDSILLRINKRERRAIGLSIFDYSYLAQKTETGVRSLPLTGLAALSEELRMMVIEILLRPPVKDFLTVSTYTPSLAESMPIASLQSDLLAIS